MIGTKQILTGMLALAFTMPAAACAQATEAMPEQRDIVEVAVQAGVFNTLVAAVQAADLVATLQGDGPFTVFAPTDEAFAALPAGTVESLLANPEALRAVLTYHVVAGRVTSSDLVAAGGANPSTVNGQNLNIVVGSGGVTVNSASVVQADVMARNGVIHVINRVLLPEMEHGGWNGLSVIRCPLSVVRCPLSPLPVSGEGTMRQGISGACCARPESVAIAHRPIGPPPWIPAVEHALRTTDARSLPRTGVQPGEAERPRGLGSSPAPITSSPSCTTRSPSPADPSRS
jgi:uncharacterized surface protein with fasciclin (FAS1) repeats